MNRFEVRVEGGEVYLSGDVDMMAIEELHRALDQAARQDGSGLTIDLSDVTFLDSSGLRELTIALRYGSAIKVRGVSPIARRVFEVTGLDLVFKMDEQIS